MILNFLRFAFCLLGFLGLSYSAQAETIRTLNLASVNWEPHYGEKLLNQGYFTEITREAFKRQGYDLRVFFVPWKRALKHAELGRYDGLLGAYKTPERAQNFLYSVPVSKSQTILASLIEANIRYKSLKELVSYKIGVIRGASGGAIFDAATYLQKIPVDSHEHNLDKILNRRIDMIFSARLHLIHTLNERMPNWRTFIEIHQPPVQENIVYNAISKRVTNPEKIIDAFNLGLEEIKADGTFDKILEKHGFK